MADENGGVVYDVDIDLTDSIAAVKRLERELDGFQGNLVHSVGLIRQSMQTSAKEYAGYIRSLQAQMEKLKDGPTKERYRAQLAGAKGRSQAAQNAQIAITAAGGQEAQTEIKATQAAVSAQINKMRTTTDALIRRMTKEVLAQSLDSINLTTEQVKARIREQQLTAARLRDRTSDPMMRAREADATFRNSEYLSNVGMQATTGRRNANRRQIQKIGDSAAQYEANIAEATFKSTQKILNASEQEFKTRSARAQLRRYRGQSFDITDETVIADRQAEQRRFRAKNGDAAAGLAMTREKMELNGGADFLKMQTSLLGNYMMIGGAMGAAGFLGNFIVQLDKEFKQFQAITATTNSAMAEMETRLLSVSEKTKFTALQIAEAATLMGQAGLSASQVGDAILPVSLLATAAGTDLKDAVDVVTSTLNIFNLQTSEASHIADVYTAALNESKLTLDQLTVSLQYAGNTAATAGVGYNELTASIGAMANAGIRSGSTMGTGIRQLLVDLMNPSKKLKGELENVGLSLSDVNVEANGLTGVITNLQEAGFGTANAFNAFEVRAAAAFTALASNVDTVNLLRQSFLLNTAATKANETQMSSLVNTWAKFTSNVGSTGYKAFKPTIGFLQEMLDVIANLIGYSNDFEGALQLVGTALASIAIAWATAKVGGIVLGLAGISMSATAASGAVGVLWNILGANPIGRVLMIATAGAIAISSMGDSAAKAADQIDKIQANIDEMNGTISEGENRIASISDTIEDLTKKRANLEKVGNEGLRATRVMEVVSTFTELAGSIDTSTASVGELITALQGLKGELTAQLPGQFALVIADLEAKITELKSAMKDYSEGDGKDELRSMVSYQYGRNGQLDQEQRYGLMNGQFDYGKFAQIIAADMGENAGAAFRAIGTNEQMGGFQAMNLKALLAADMKNNDSEIRRLRGLDERTPEQEDRLASLTANTDSLRVLAAAFEKYANFQINLTADEKTLELQRQQAVGVGVRARPKYKAIDANVSELGAFARDGLKEISDAQGPNGKGLDVKEVAKRLAALDEALKVKLAKIDADAKTLGEAMGPEAADYLDNAPFRSRIAELQNPVNSENIDVAGRIRKLDAHDAKRQQGQLSRELTAAMTELNKARNDQEVDIVKANIKRIQARLKAVNEQVFDLTNVKATEDSPEQQAIDRSSMLDDLEIQFKENEEAVRERRAEIYKKETEAREDRLRTELGNVTDEMRTTLESMNGNQSVEMIKQIRLKLDELGARARLLAGQIAQIDVGQDFIPVSGAVGTMADGMKGGTAPVATGGNVRDQVWNFFAQKGLKSHQIAGIMGNVAQESTFNPLAAGDADKNGVKQAFGLFQHNDRKNKLFDFIGGKGNLGDVQKQLEFAWHELQTTENASYKKLMTAGNVREATEAFLGFERPQGYNTGVRNSHGYGSRVGAAEEAFKRYGGGSAPTPETQRQDAVDAETTKLTAPVDRTLQRADQNVVKAQRDALAKTLQTDAKRTIAEINSLMTQSGTMTDPQALNSILDQVKGKWATVIEKETQAFSEKNAGSDTLDEDLKAFREGLDAKLNQDVIQLLDKYQNAIEREMPEGLKVAKAQLEAAQDPVNEGKYSSLEIQQLQNNVALQERAAVTERLNALEQFRLLVTQQLSEAEAQYGANSEQANALRARQAEVEKTIGDGRLVAVATTEAASKSEMSLKTSIEAANAAWAQRNGLMTGANTIISMAQQAGEAWGQVLDGLTTGFATLFTDLASGTMDAGEAFKKLGLSVVDMLMKIIAQQLALQLVQSTMGQVGGAASGGGFLSMLFGVPSAPGAATGGIIPGVKRAAGGEIITGGSPHRDSVLRNVMPGEAILRASAVTSIGEDRVREMNALGNRSLSEGATAVDAAAANDNAGGTVNVWVVLPEEQVKMGPKDVVAAVTDDMRNRGMTRQLVKAIQMGQV